MRVVVVTVVTIAFVAVAMKLAPNEPSIREQRPDDERAANYSNSVTCEADCQVSFGLANRHSGEQGEISQGGNYGANDDVLTLGESDLLAQERMAFWTKAIGVFTAIGLGILFVTFAATRDAVVETRKIGEAQTRAYLSVIDAEIVDPEFSDFAFDVIVTIKNFGQSPAFQFRWLAEPTLQYFWGNNHHAPSESDLEKIRPFDTPIVISAGTEEQIRIPILEKAVHEIMDGRGPGDLILVGSIELFWKDVFKRDNQATAWLRPEIDSDTLPGFRGKLMVTNHDPEKDKANAKKP
ncbi:hypothetical protein [Hyphococcus sp. DH-69]|uniref:hypothetical protein n=1 Tax=Hyphococcus formosus TaxID=3143534 RepID=UPI00398ADD55